MPRIGMNPARGHKTDYTPPEVTVAVLTHLPDSAGYFKERFDVTRLCLESLIANTQPPHDLMVFDNGSCAELVEYLKGLREKGLVNYLLLSNRNIGKIGALQMMFQAAPGKIVAYTDDDIFFLPGWLEAHLEIIHTFPKAGMVTGLYIRSRGNSAIASTLAFSQQPEVTVARGNFIPKEWEVEYVENSNRTWERYQSEIAGLEDIVLTYQGVEAFVSAHHFQFVAPRQAVLQALPEGWSGNLMGQMLELEEAMDQAGYLRLSTRSQTVHLLGNSLEPDRVKAAQGFGLELSKTRFTSSSGFLRRLAKVPLVRSLAYGVYNRLFEILNA